MSLNNAGDHGVPILLNVPYQVNLYQQYCVTSTALNCPAVVKDLLKRVVCIHTLSSRGIKPPWTPHHKEVEYPWKLYYLRL
jgi:hypothetical protein